MSTNLRLKVLERALKPALRFQELSLHSRRSFEITDITRKCINQPLKRFSFLQSFQMMFSDFAGITDIGLENLCHSLQNLVLLRNFSLFWSVAIRLKDLKSYQND